MLHSIHEMKGYTICARDGEIGTVDRFLFDDQHWTIRYMIVDTGGWLSGRRVLISPISIRTSSWDKQLIDVGLTKQQVEHSPGIHTDEPVSRQKEAELAQYYGYAPYWGGAGVWGAGLYPAPLLYAYPTRPAAMAPPAVPARPTAEQEFGTQERGDPHLRSTEEVIGYTIQARDGDIGQVDDFLVDDETWTLRYMVVDAGSWWSGKKVLVAPEWIGTISWERSSVVVDLTREMIKGAPVFDPYTPVSRNYEAQLYEYYGRPAYWQVTQRG
ncbi:MAG: PRC-barrel domain-containing protein [Chloroflexota bacterium]|nr:PRC-barrel domain-containing protein [Chloroflexota bacterium]